jgi:hypothetical protein
LLIQKTSAWYNSTFHDTTVIANHFTFLQRFYGDCTRKKASCSGISKEEKKKLSICWLNDQDNCVVAVKIFPPAPGEKDLKVHLQFKKNEGGSHQYGAVGIGYKSEMDVSRHYNHKHFH